MWCYKLQNETRVINKYEKQKSKSLPKSDKKQKNQKQTSSKKDKKKDILNKKQKRVEASSSDDSSDEEVLVRTGDVPEKWYDGYEHVE